MVTVMNAEGKPVQVPAGALQAANVQNHIGKIYDSKTVKLCEIRLVIDQISAAMTICKIIIDLSSTRISLISPSRMSSLIYP